MEARPYRHLHQILNDLIRQLDRIDELPHRSQIARVDQLQEQSHQVRRIDICRFQVRGLNWIAMQKRIERRLRDNSARDQVIAPASASVRLILKGTYYIRRNQLGLDQQIVQSRAYFGNALQIEQHGAHNMRRVNPSLSNTNSRATQQIPGKCPASS